MSCAEFDSGHMSLIKDLNPQKMGVQYGDHNVYFVSQENFDELRHRLGHFSCGYETVDWSWLYNRFACRRCPKEGKISAVITGDENRVMFYGYPRDLYKVKTHIGLDKNSVQRCLEEYLEKLPKTMEKRFYEELAEPVKEHVPFEREKKKITVTELDRTWMALQTLKELALKEEVFKDSYQEEEYHFRLCGEHRGEADISELNKEFRKKTVERCNKCGLSLKEDEIEVDFREERIFSVEK